MNDETKEILEKILLNCDTQEEKNKLLDYITNLQDTLKDREEYCYGLETQLTNLQKENERLYKELEKADSITQSCIFEGSRSAGKSYRQCLNWLEDYKSRNEKAIEFNQIVLNSDYVYSQDEIAQKNLNILQGEDKE